VRDAATRSQSTNNLKQIALSFHAFHDANKRLPGNGGDIANPKYKAEAQASDSFSGSWGFMILPYIEQALMFQNVDRKTGVPTFMCPGRPRPQVETSNGGGAWTDYFYNNQMANEPDKPASFPKYKINTIPDGSSNTIMLGHGNINKKQYTSDKNVTLSTNIFKGGTTGTIRSIGNDKERPVILAPDSDNDPTIGSWGGPFRQGLLVSLYDGSVRMVSYRCSAATFRNALTPADGNPLGSDWD
jgi:hypothetical protein